MRTSLALICLTGGLLLFGCWGGVEDKEGNRLKVGEQYVMTKEGLEHVPYLKDRFGNRVEPGRQYLMTSTGLEPVPYLRDKFGKKVELGGEYIMTEEGLQFVRSRAIKGMIQDSSGKPVPGVAVMIADTGLIAVSDSAGSFSFPFIEGYVRLQLEPESVPSWCLFPDTGNVLVTGEEYPNGWDMGAVKLSCQYMGTKGDKGVWATADGAYVDNGDGTASDTLNHLMWQTDVEEHAVSWDRAVEYSQGLRLAGYSDWRLPTPTELSTLFQSGVACRWHGSPLIRGALTLWTSEQEGPTSAVTYNICTGGSRKSAALDEGASVNPSVLAVRTTR